MTQLPYPVTLMIVGLLVQGSSARAQQIDVDWKYFGGAPYDGGSLCFFEAHGRARTLDQVRVWTKCLPKEALSTYHLTDEMRKRVVHKVVSYYAPPITKVIDIDGNQAGIITMYEEIANNGYLEPTIQMFYELDCTQGKIRDLSSDMTINGRRGYSNTPSDWSYIGPEGNAATLRKILCEAN